MSFQMHVKLDLIIINFINSETLFLKESVELQVLHKSWNSF